MVWLAITPIVLPAFLLAILWLFESLWLIVIASPAAVASYHFGSEAMIGHGGWKYSSVHAYEAFGLLGGALLLVGVGAVLHGAYHSKRAWIFAGIAGMFAIILFDLSWAWR